MSSIYDLVIFDWDGTLFDSVNQIVESLLYAAEQHQIELAAADARNIIGLGLPEAMQALFPSVPELHSSIRAEYASHYIANSHRQHWFTGVAELLDALQSRQVGLAVATGKNRPGLDRVLLQTNSVERFISTRCADETKSKPHPLMLEEILQETGVSVERAVMVGDTTYDMEMAAKIGMPRIAVSYGVHRPDELQRFSPLYIANSIEELSRALLK
jgi:phosphoglycolate phosphatase